MAIQRKKTKDDLVGKLSLTPEVLSSSPTKAETNFLDPSNLELPETAEETLDQIKMLYATTAINAWKIGQRFDYLHQLHKKKALPNQKAEKFTWRQFIDSLPYQKTNVYEFISIYQRFPLEALQDAQLDKESLALLAAKKTNEEVALKLLNDSKNEPLTYKDTKKKLQELQPKKPTEATFPTETSNSYNENPIEAGNETEATCISELESSIYAFIVADTKANREALLNKINRDLQSVIKATPK